MAKSNNSLSSLFRAKPPTNLIAPGQSKSSSARTTSKATRSSDLRALPIGAKDTATGINFGSPSSPNSGYASGTQWTKLLAQTATGGVASAASGAVGMGGFGGLGSAISGIFKLFGGGSQKTLPSLVEFKLPNPETQTVYVSSSGSTTYEGSSVGTPSAPKRASAIYTNSGQVSTSTSATSSTYINQSAQIAQAVKNALLTSSSLNDVIAEI